MMFGLFDSPPKKIRKRVPVAFLHEYDALHDVALSLPEAAGLAEQKKQMLAGIALSVWACNSAAQNRFQLNDYDFRTIQNLGGNCARFLGSDSSRIEPLLDRLIEAELFPKQRNEET